MNNNLVLYLILHNKNKCISVVMMVEVVFFLMLLILVWFLC